MCFKENLFLFNSGLSEKLDYTFFTEVFIHLGEFNRNKKSISDNNRADWTQDLDLVISLITLSGEE